MSDVLIVFSNDARFEQEILKTPYHLTTSRLRQTERFRMPDVFLPLERGKYYFGFGGYTSATVFKRRKKTEGFKLADPICSLFVGLASRLSDFSFLRTSVNNLARGRGTWPTMSIANNLLIQHTDLKEDCLYSMVEHR